MSARRRRLRVLVVAYACNPTQGSEEGVGWGFVQALAQDHTLTVLTAAFHVEAIEAWRREHPDALRDATFVTVPHRQRHYRPSPGWKRIENGALKPLMNLAYVGWQTDAFALAQRLHATDPFDVVHLLTYVGFRFPGRFWRIDAPFVWGPIGGLENTPWRFLPVLGAYGGAYHAVRNVINSVQKRTLRGPRLAFRRARGGILAATGGIRRGIRQRYREQSRVLCEVGTPPYVAAGITQREAGEPLRLAWSALHQPGKALPLLLRALVRLDERVAWSLVVLGHGGSTGRWRAEAEDLRIADRITWTGWLPREEALRRMHEAHAFVITSLKDLTSTVLLEALSLGLPVICPAHCGFADVVTPACGIRIPLTTPADFIKDLATAVQRLHDDESARQSQARQALRRSREFAWADKAHLVGQVYADVVARRPRLKPIRDVGTER